MENDGADMSLVALWIDPKSNKQFSPEPEWALSRQRRALLAALRCDYKTKPSSSSANQNAAFT